MHELSICESIARAALKHADGRRIDVINVRIGQLRQVIPETLSYCWSVVCYETELEGSRLQIESVPAQVRCQQCDVTAVISEPVMLCPRCGGTGVELVSGEEFLITTIELTEV